MMTVETYRFKITGAMGQNPRVVERDASYLNESGFRCSLSPELLCDELTADVRNGVNSLDLTDLGLQLNPLDVVQVVVTDGQTETPIFFGDLRTGGNRMNPDLEGISIRGFDQRLREVSLENAAYSQQDVARLVDQVILSLAQSGQMGTATITFPVAGIPKIVTRSGFRYDAGLQPTLGITLSIDDTEGGLVGDLLDKIVEAAFAVNPAQPLAWGVRPDGYFWFGLKRQDVLALDEASFRSITWPAPVATAPVTVVQWLIDRRSKGGLFKLYQSRSDKADLYGARVKTLTVNPGDTALWTNVPFTIQAWYPDLGDGFKTQAIGWLTDGDKTTRVALRNAVSDTNMPYITVQPSAAFDRVQLNVSFAAPTTSAEVGSLTPDGAYSPLYTEVPGMGFAGNYYPPGDPQAGTLVRVKGTATVAGDSAGILVAELQPQVLNRALLDARAAYYYKLPAIDPTDAEFDGFLEPSAFRGRLRFTGVGYDYATGYERAIEKFEYRMSGGGGLSTGILTGQADDPEIMAKADIIKASIAAGVVIAVKAS